jgi:hypothetical protein
VTTTVAAATAATAAATTEIRCESIGGVSDFFDVPAPPEPPPEPRYRLPPWLGPPRGELPGVVPFELVLARTERVAVCLAALRAYSTGFLVDLVTLSAEDDEALDPELFPHHRRGRPTEGLRFGLEFADGRRATNLGFPPGSRSESPDGPVLHPRGGGGGGGQWHQEQWAWPLPPPGSLAFVCEWPAVGIEVTRTEVDARAILDASARAQVIFDQSHLPEADEW